MKKHTDKQCLNPKTYSCRKCSQSFNRERDVIKHLKDFPDCNLGHQEHAPSARNKFASCLTGKVFNTEAELIDDAYEHCKGSKAVPTADHSLRLRALLSDIPELKQEVEKQCCKETTDPKLWQLMKWPDSDARRFSNLAEYGLQTDNTSTVFDGTEHFVPPPGRNLEQQRLGIPDVRSYVTEVLRTSSLGCFFDPVSNQQHELSHSSVTAAAWPTTASTATLALDDVSNSTGSDSRFSNLSGSQPAQLVGRDWTNDDLHVPQTYEPSGGTSHQRSDSVDMEEPMEALAGDDQEYIGAFFPT